MTALHRIRIAPLLGAALLACADAGPRPGTVALHVTIAPAGAQTAAAGDGLVVVRGGDTLIVRQAELVLRETVLQRARFQECEEEAGEDCAVLSAAATRFVLPLGGGGTEITRAPVPVDAYSTVQFEVYRPSPERDSAFVAAHPDLAGTSVRVRGTLSRAGARRDFDYRSEFNEVQEVVLDGPLGVKPRGRGDVTLRVDVARWFLTADGTALLDPSTAVPEGDVEIQVRDNLRQSFAAAPTSPVRASSSP